MGCRLGTNMGIMNIMFLALVCLIFNLFYGGLQKVEGRKEPFLSREEDLELEGQLTVLNKPPVQSFKKDDGSIIDCIDIHKQPAFDHPLLKKHELQMQPSSLLLEKMSSSSLEQQEDDQLTHNSKSKFPGCPSGTVPIRRTRKGDLIRAKAALKHYPSMHGIIGVPFTHPEGVHFAGVGTPNGTSDKYLGAKAGVTLFNLTMAISSQTSTTSLRLGTGVDGPFSSIEYGYTFNQELYGDTKCRTYSLWTADGFQKTGCFNQLCSGFVQVSTIRHMGDEFTYFSGQGQGMQFMLFGILKDPSSGNWWLIESIPEARNHTVGYWPKELFPNMKDYATNVQVGGKVFNPSVEPSKTPMGSGHYWPSDLIQSSNAEYHIVDSSYKFIVQPRMDVLADAPDFYKASVVDNIVLFGGPDIHDE